MIFIKLLGWPGFEDWLLSPLSAGCRPEFESSLPLHQDFFFSKGFWRGCQLLKVLRKQHEGTGQSSSSKKKEDYAKVFERILSGGEIFEGDLPPSYSVSSRNLGRKRKKETERKERERDRYNLQRRDTDFLVSVTAPHLQEQQLKCVLS